MDNQHPWAEPTPTQARAAAAAAVLVHVQEVEPAPEPEPAPVPLTNDALVERIAATQRDSEGGCIVGRNNGDARVVRRGIAEETVRFCEQHSYSSPVDGSPVALSIAQAVATTQLFSGSATAASRSVSPTARRARGGAGAAGPAAAATPATEMHVVQGGAIAVAEALTDLAPNERVGLLNFASGRHPGGGFLKGANAQEESIARCTGLYPCLVSAAAAAYYTENSSRAVKGIYTDAAIISPSVPLFRHESGSLLSSPRELCVVTCPAPNLGAMAGDEREASLALRRRMVKVLTLFASKAAAAADSDAAGDGPGVDTVILGAWGCGVFKHDPADVVAHWGELLQGKFAGVFKRVVFAIIDEETCEVFQRAFASESRHGGGGRGGRGGGSGSGKSGGKGGGGEKEMKGKKGLKSKQRKDASRAKRHS